MPIKKENRKRYPKNWKEIRLTILDRANHMCEGSPMYPDCRAKNKINHPVTGSKVVLTVAHLDHTPENSEPSNLKAWCQRCHLTYDAKHHAENAKTTRKMKETWRTLEFRTKNEAEFGAGFFVGIGAKIKEFKVSSFGTKVTLDVIDTGLWDGMIDYHTDRMLIAYKQLNLMASADRGVRKRKSS